MIYWIRHQTTYRYADTVQLAHNLAHLCPREDSKQRVRSFRLDVTPEPAALRESDDSFGNRQHFMIVQEGHKEFTVVARSVVEVLPTRPPSALLAKSWEEVASHLAGRPWGYASEASQYRHTSPYVPLLQVAKEWASTSFTPGRNLVELALDLMKRVFKEFTYDPQATSVATPLAEVFKVKRGVCQDFAHVLIAAFRTHGLAARYVSGYLETQPPPGKPRLIGADASHAWVQIWESSLGWIDLDPTNAIVPSERHVTISVGRDFSDVTPLKGLLLGGGDQTVRVSVDVEPASAPATSTNFGEIDSDSNS